MNISSVGFSLRHSVSFEQQHQAMHILEYLWGLGISVYCTDQTLLAIGDVFPLDKKKRLQEDSSIDVMIFFGGDGTLLKTVHLYAPKFLSIPIVGIHAGNVGFFSSVLPESFIKAFENILLDTDVFLEERMLIKGVLHDSEGRIEREFYSLNECTIHHAGIARLRHLSTWVDGVFLTSYRADGLVVATPTGSTAYNLAAGGPLLSVDMQAMVITPLAPSGFSQRPIVFSADKTITIKTDANMLISVDGQEYFPFPEGHSLHLTRHQEPLCFIRQATESYFSTLREKLGWG